MHMLVSAILVVYFLLKRTSAKSCIDLAWVQTSSSLHFVFQEQHFDCFTIRRWQEALTVYPRTNKQNQKKKRKVDPPTQQVMHLQHTIHGEVLFSHLHWTGYKAIKFTNSGELPTVDFFLARTGSQMLHCKLNQETPVHRCKADNQERMKLKLKEYEYE